MVSYRYPLGSVKEKKINNRQTQWPYANPRRLSLCMIYSSHHHHYILPHRVTEDDLKLETAWSTLIRSLRFGSRRRGSTLFFRPYLRRRPTEWVLADRSPQIPVRKVQSLQTRPSVGHVRQYRCCRWASVVQRLAIAKQGALLSLRLIPHHYANLQRSRAATCRQPACSDSFGYIQKLVVLWDLKRTG